MLTHGQYHCSSLINGQDSASQGLPVLLHYEVQTLSMATASSWYFNAFDKWYPCHLPHVPHCSPFQ